MSRRSSMLRHRLAERPEPGVGRAVPGQLDALDHELDHRHLGLEVEEGHGRDAELAEDAGVELDVPGLDEQPLLALIVDPDVGDETDAAVAQRLRLDDGEAELLVVVVEDGDRVLEADGSWAEIVDRALQEGYDGLAPEQLDVVQVDDLVEGGSLVRDV